MNSRKNGDSLSLFLRSRTQDDRDKMIAQREPTNRAVTELQTIYRDHQKTSSVIQVLDSLSRMRDDLNAVPVELNSVKSHLLDEISATSRSSRNSDIKNMLEAHLFLLYAKEYLARIRAILAGSILSKGFQKGEYGEFSSTKGQYENKPV